MVLAGTLDVNGLSTFNTVNMNNTKIKSLAEPTLGTDAATKAYVDQHSSTPTDLLLTGTLDVNGLSSFHTVNMNNTKINSLATPTNDNDAATKAYVDQVSIGLDFKKSVRVATTNSDSNINLSGIQTIDGIDLNINDRILVKNKTGDQANKNGIYQVLNGAWIRTSDFDSNVNVSSGLFVFVEEGTINNDSGWVLTTDGTIILDTTPLEFTQFSKTGEIMAGVGLSKNGTVLSVNNSLPNVTSLTGLTTIGTINQGTWEGSVINKNFISNDLVINNGEINNTPIGNTGVSTGKFSNITTDMINISNINTDFFIQNQSNSGNITINNKVSDKKIIMKLGSNTNTSSFNIYNNLDESKFSVDGSGNVSVSGTLTASVFIPNQTLFGTTTFEDLTVTGNTSLATTGGPVNISKMNNLTTILGTLNVKQDVTLDTALSVSGITTLVNKLNANGGISCVNNVDLIFGTETNKQTVVNHDGSDFLLQNNISAGDITIHNKDADKKIIMKLGSDSSSSTFEVNNNNGNSLMKVNGLGTATFTDDIIIKDIKINGLSTNVSLKTLIIALHQLQINGLNFGSNLINFIGQLGDSQLLYQVFDPEQ